MAPPPATSQKDVALTTVTTGVDLAEARPTFERIGRLASAYSKAEFADAVLLGSDLKWYASQRPGWVGDILPKTAFSAAAIESGEVLWVEDTAADPRFADHPLVADAPHLRFWAGAPICLPSGERVGVVAVADREPRAFDAELAAYLQDLAAIAANECGRHYAQSRLASADSALEAAEALSAAFVEAAPVAICMTNRDMRVIQTSPRWRIERKQPEARGLSLYETYPDTRRWRRVYEHCLKGNAFQNDKVPINLHTGERRWVRVEITPWRDSQGEVGGLLIMSVDVTRMVEALEEAERNQERLKLALEIGELRMWEMDFARRRLSAAGAVNALDATVTYDDLDADIWQAVHPEDRPGAEAAWKAYVKGGEPFRQIYRMRRKGGEGYQWHDSACEAFRDPQGRIDRVVGVLRNIDAQKRSEMELRRAKEEAEAANTAKSEFLANMSHEIRTPLNGVMGVAGALARTELSAAQAEMVKLIETSAQTLEALLTDILDLARIEAGRLEIRPEPFDLKTSVNACAALFEASARAKDLELKVEIDPYAEGAYAGDAPRIRQILSNLLGNAVKFTSSGEVKLAVKARRDETTTHLDFVVSDTGIGFDEETKARLFGRFQQADGSITRQYGGTGLGLAISRSLAEAMGGDLSAEATPGEGARFTLSLELPRRHGAVEMWGEHEAITAEPELAAMRVLLAEDHPTNTRVVQLILGAAGVDLICVENGADAVDEAARSAFDLILMDMQMPVMDGLTAIRAIRLREARDGRPPTPIYTLTANAMPEHAEASSAAGADGHVTKPITAEALLRVVEQVCSEKIDAEERAVVALSA